MQAEQEKKKSALRELAETILITLVIYALVRTFLFENYRVVGRSMYPTLENDQFLVVNKLGYRLNDPQRGDIIVFRDQSVDGRKLIKRVIGLPGEQLRINNGEVFIDGNPLDEPYLVNPGRSSQPEINLPVGHYFVMGDNRNNSSDSRSWGTLDGSSIVGEALLSYWPPQLWGLLPQVEYGDGTVAP